MRPYYSDSMVSLWNCDYRDGLADALCGARAYAVVTDPPYGETNLAWDRWVDGWLDDAAQITDALWCFGSFRMFHEHAAEFAGWKFSQDVIWEKHNGSGLAADRFRRVHEIAALWYRGAWDQLRHETPTTPDATPRALRRRATKGDHQGSRGASAYTSEDGGPRLMRSVQQVRSMHGDAIHPTQKPVRIVAPLIEYSVPPGGIVVDLFAGSGTTAEAARNLGRRCIAFEADEAYAELAARRLSQQAFDFGEAS